MDKQDYHTNSSSESEEDTYSTPPGYIPPTPPRPRGDAGAYRVILDKDVEVNFTEYFTDSEDKDKGDKKKPWVHDQYTLVDMDIPQNPELDYSNAEEEGDTQPLNITVDAENKENLILDGTSESAYEGDISTHATDTTVDGALRRKTRRRKLAPILRTAYYGCKRLMGGIRHFVSSVTEYAAGASLGSSSRKIPFYSLLVSPTKPKTKNKIPDPTRASVLCDTGTSISLAPLSIAREMKIKVDKTQTRSIRKG